MIKYLISLSFCFLLLGKSMAQNQPYEFVISGGTGFAISNLTLKSGVNLGLKKAGLDSKVQNTWMVNGMFDLCVSKNISVGLAYSHYQFYWTDGYEDTIQGIPVIVNAGISIQKRNYAIRGLYHFNKSENFEIYTGARLGLSHWIVDVNTDGDIAGKTPVSEFKFPAMYPSIQLIGGFRHYFGRVFGWFGEIGIGTSPYLCSIGINIRPNPKQ